MCPECNRLHSRIKRVKNCLSPRQVIKRDVVQYMQCEQPRQVIRRDLVQYMRAHSFYDDQWMGKTSRTGKKEKN